MLLPQELIVGHSSSNRLIFNLLRGNLVKAEWKPERGIVELKSPAVSATECSQYPHLLLPHRLLNLLLAMGGSLAVSREQPEPIRDLCFCSRASSGTPWGSLNEANNVCCLRKLCTCWSV